MTLILALMAWIIGISSMGLTQIDAWVPRIAAINVLCLVLALGLGWHNHRQANQCSISAAWACGRLALLISVLLLGHRYAEHALTQRLALRHQTVSSPQVLIYVDRIASNGQADPNRWHHQVWVLDQQAQAVRWRLSYPTHHINPKNPEQWLKLGQYYRVSGQVKGIHAFAVDGVFDQERWWIQQGLMASMQVHSIQAVSAAQVSAWGHADFVRQQQGVAAGFRIAIEAQRLQWRQLIEQQGFEQRGLMLALLTGDQSLLAAETQDLFKRLGISHLLAISGPHVLIFALIFCLLCRRMINLFVPQLYLSVARPDLLLLPFLLCVALYAGIVGFEIPALRTLLTVTLISLCLWLRQPLSALKLLLLSASLLLLFDPLSILSAAFWLSYGACLILLRVYQQLPSGREQAQKAAAHVQPNPHSDRPNRRQRRSAALSTRVNHLHPWLSTSLSNIGHVLLLLRILLLTQCRIFIALLPLILLIFQQVSWLAPIANLLAIPLIAMLIVPLEVIAAMLSLLWPSVAMLLFYLADLCNQLLMFLLTRLDQGMGLQLHGVALTTAQIMCLGLAVLMLMLARGVVPRGWMVLSAFAAVLLHRPQTAFDLSVIDVGQGQAVFLQLPQHSMMIDVGGSFQEQQWGIGEQVIIPFLLRRGVRRLDQVVLTHLDQDHSGAFTALSQRIPIQKVYSNQEDQRFQQHDFDYCFAGQRWQYGQVSIQVLSPSAEQLASAAEKQNERSCVLYIQVPQAKNYQYFLLMADAGWETEYQILRDYPDLKVDVLLLGHHGSRYSSSYAFLKQLQPKLALASAGWNNRYHHPHPVVEARLKALGIPFKTTIEQGSMRFFLNADRQMVLHSQRDTRRWLKRDQDHQDPDKP